jgi:arylsulfatase A
VDDKTLVIFTSDNGPWLSYGNHAGTAGPLREGKGTTFEGGVRVPFVARWPAKIPGSSVCTEPAMTIDLLPTIAKLAGSGAPKLPIDGKDVSPLLLGEKGAKSPHEAYFFYWGQELQAVRMAKWKLHFPHGYRTLKEAGKDGKPGPYAQARIDLTLYDLSADVGEARDVAAANPAVVAQIRALADAVRSDLGDTATKQIGKGVRPAAVLQAPK